MGRVVEQRDRFLATLSHELRNPLMAITTAAEVLRAGSDVTPSTRRAADVVVRSAQHMANLLDDLLDLSGSIGSAGHTSPVIDLRTAIDALAQELPNPEGACLEVRVPAFPVYVRGERERLRKAFAHLLTNAIESSPAASTVRLMMEVEADSVVVRVRDRGVGMDPETLARAFEPFFQARQRAHAGLGLGLGLGLALVASIVKAHGGDVAATSDGHGFGTEVAVRLPRVEWVRAEPGAEPDHASPGRALRVLLVEDQDDSRELLHTALQGRGHQVISVRDLETAEQALQREVPDVALIDLGLPDGPGHAVARAARRYGGDAVLLVALTGRGQARDYEEAKASGFDHHLVKPASLDDIDLLITRPRR